VPSSRIQLLGEIGVGVARAYARTPGPPDVTSTAQLWDLEVQRLTLKADTEEWEPLSWEPFSFETLANNRALLEDESAELRFASRLAFFLESLAEGRDLAQSVLSLLDVSAYAPDDLAPEVANESLRLVEASAPIVAATPEGQVMLTSERLPSVLESLRLDDDLERRVDMTAVTLDHAAAASGVHAKPLRTTFDLDDFHPQGETFVNVGVDDVKAPGSGPSIDRVAPNETIWVWVELGPRNPDAAAGDAEPVHRAALVDGQELEVVVFPDATLAVTPAPAAGRVRIVSSGAFPVVRSATATLGDAGADKRLLGSRLYFRVMLPREPGVPRLRVAVYLKGVLVHVEQLSLPVGLDRKPTVRTTHRLVRTFEAADRFESLRSPTLSIYSNAGDATHDFSFYLPGRTEAEAGIPSQLHLDSSQVVTAIETARRTLRQIAWGDPEELDGQKSLFPDDGHKRFGNATNVGQALLDLAVVGHHLWGYLSRELERDDPDFRHRLQEAMRPPGAVQLSTTDHPNQILPLQVLYDRNLDTAAPTYLKLCSATAEWLEKPDASDPPCLATGCPDEGSTKHVCVAGFWGIRHGVSINPAHRSGELSSEVKSSSAKPVATLATTTDRNVEPYWTKHEVALKEILDVPSNTSITAPPIFKSLEDDRSVLLYVLAHVDCETDFPRIWMSEGPDGAIDWSTLNKVHPSLQEHQPVVFINACASAAMSPERLLSLVGEFFLYGAGGAVGTEITIFVDFAAFFANVALERYASGETLSQSLRHARIEGLRAMNPMGFAYLGFGLHDLRLASAHDAP
jgi:hypothetical protein